VPRVEGGLSFEQSKEGGLHRRPFIFIFYFIYKQKKK